MSIFRKKPSKSFLDEINELNLYDLDINHKEFLSHVRNMKNVDRKFQNGMTLLHIASEHFSIKLAQTLLDLKCSVDLKNDYGNTPLWIAVFNSRGNYQMVDLLIKNGANPNISNNSNNSPLKFARNIEDDELIFKLENNFSL